MSRLLIIHPPEMFHRSISPILTATIAPFEISNATLPDKEHFVLNLCLLTENSDETRSITSLVLRLVSNSLLFCLGWFYTCPSFEYSDVRRIVFVLWRII